MAEGRVRMAKKSPPSQSLTSDVSGWKNKLGDVLATDSQYGESENLRPVLRDASGEEARTFPVSSLSVDGTRTRRSILDEEPFEPEPREPPLSKEELTKAIQLQAHNVTKSFQRRQELDEPVAPPSHPNGAIKHVAPFDESKIHKLEEKMAKQFNDKVSAPMTKIVAARTVEQGKAKVSEFCRANELFDKGDYLASLAEYQVAAGFAHIGAYVAVNRGNAFKALKYEAEAATCYQQALDELPLTEPATRVLHAFVLCNLGSIREDEGRMQQALQNYSAALAINPQCHVASRNRANLHLRNAEKLRVAGVPGAAPPQHEIAFDLFGRALDVDWQLPHVVRAEGVPVRLETRIVRGNEVYHFSVNLTHTGDEYRHL